MTMMMMMMIRGRWEENDEVDVEEEEENDDVEGEDVDEEDRSQDQEAHFVRACAVKMHMDIWQEPLCVKFTGKMPGPNPGDIVSCEPAQSKCTWTFEKSHFVWNFQEKCRTPIPRHTFCVSLRSRFAHGHFTRAILCGNLQEKCRTPIPGKAFCASLRSRNAHGHFTRAICMEINRKNAARAGYHLDQTPGINPHRRNPFSVATLFGEKHPTTSLAPCFTLDNCPKKSTSHRIQPCREPYLCCAVGQASPDYTSAENARE